jgi:hypothetical protein
MTPRPITVVKDALVARILAADEDGAATGPDAGMISAFVLAMMLGLFAVLGLGLDPGLALADKVHAIGQAEQAARAGAQQIDLTTYRTTGQLRLDPVAANQAAQQFLTFEHATGDVEVTGNTVTVTITSDYRTHLWALIGVDAITVHATGRATPQRGITAPEPP